MIDPTRHISTIPPKPKGVEKAKNAKAEKEDRLSTTQATRTAPQAAPTLLEVRQALNDLKTILQSNKSLTLGLDQTVLDESA